MPDFFNAMRYSGFSDAFSLLVWVLKGSAGPPRGQGVLLSFGDLGVYRVEGIS